LASRDKTKEPKRENKYPVLRTPAKIGSKNVKEEAIVTKAE
jgi:hypothetical protein